MRLRARQLLEKRSKMCRNQQKKINKSNAPLNDIQQPNRFGTKLSKK